MPLKSKFSLFSLLKYLCPQYLTHNRKSTPCILNDLTSKLIPTDKKLRDLINVKLICNKERNAFALPGGSILITSGLLAAIDSENALSAVLAHEIGHIKKRHHLKRMSLAGAWLILSRFIGNDFSSLIENIALFNNNAYSRDAELEADQVSKSILLKKYGHLKGATEFFISLKEENNFDIPLLNSHPGLSSRISFFSASPKSQKLKTTVLPKEEMLKLCQSEQKL